MDLTKALFLGLALSLCLPLDAADKAPLAPPTASAAPTSMDAPAEPVAPAAPVGAGATLSPSAEAPADLSPTAAAEDPMVPEEVEDPLALSSQATLTDLKPLSSAVLAKLAGALGPDADAVWFDAESGEAVDASSTSAARVDAEALYGELAYRLVRKEDKDARAALGLAIMKKDPRAKEAKALAFEDKLADSVIAQLEAGSKTAPAELQKLADKGNRRARQHLGLDAPPAAEAPTAPQPATAPAEPTAPSAASPSAKP